MKYRKLGASDLEVSEISLGSWLTYGVGVERDKAKACVDKAFDLGINFIDTTNVYGAMSDTDQGLSRAQILKQIDASLQRLRVDHVDLYQCHRYDTNTPLEETMEALSDVVKAGKARWIVFSEWSPAQIDAAFALPGVERFVSSQPQYSLLWRRPEAKVIPICAANGVSQIVWSPLAQGVLSGKYQPGAAPPAQSRATSDQMGGAMQNWLRPDILELVQQLKPIAARAGCSLTQFSLAWVLREPNVASAIVGASRPEQLEENAGASGLAIDPALFREAEALVAGLERTR